MVPFLGPLFGGFVAGYIAKGDVMNAGKAGFVAGILATIVIALVILAGMASLSIAGYIPQLIPAISCSSPSLCIWRSLH